jgi:hypothetical protein
MTFTIPTHDAAIANPDLRASFITSLREARAMGWKPNKTEQAAIDAFFKKAPGKASEKPVESARKKALRADKAFKAGKGTATITFKVGDKVVQRTVAKSFATAMQSIEKKLAHFPEGTVTVQIADSLCNSKADLELASGKRNVAAHIKPVSDRKAQRAAMVVPESPEEKAAKPVSPKGNEAVKVALNAALQGMAASMQAIQAAIAAL